MRAIKSAGGVGIDASWTDERNRSLFVWREYRCKLEHDSNVASFTVACVTWLHTETTTHKSHESSLPLPEFLAHVFGF